jgi:F0F1-type ATP synthase delta subunit
MTTEKEISIWVKSLLLIFKEDDKEKQSLAAKKLQEILKKKKKEYLLPAIIKKLERAYSKENKIDLFLAKNHSPRTQEELAKKLLVFFGKGKKISLKINPELIGGFRAKTSDFLVKASVKDFLDELQNNYLASN